MNNKNHAKIKFIFKNRIVLLVVLLITIFLVYISFQKDSSKKIISDTSSKAFVTWTGPRTTIIQLNGQKLLKICSAPDSCKITYPFFFAYNTQTDPIIHGDWNLFDYQIKLFLEYTQKAGVTPILQVHILSPEPAFLKKLAEKLNALNPRPYLILRMFVYPEDEMISFLPKSKAVNVLGEERSLPSAASMPYALSEEWIKTSEKHLEKTIKMMDNLYPARLLGIQICYMQTGEWFFCPFNKNGHPPFFEIESKNNIYPWSNDKDPLSPGIFDYFYGGMSNTSELEFCKWKDLPDTLKTNCRLPTLYEMNNSPNQTAPASSPFLDPTNLDQLRSIYFSRFTSHRVAYAIERLLKKAKEVTNGKILTSAFYGYVYPLNAWGSLSGSTALTELINSPYIDMIASPYDYGKSRQLDYSMAPQGPADSLALENKLWVHEVDLRTHFAANSSLKKSKKLEDSEKFLSRHIFTSILRNNGIYLLDLFGSGWFGQPDKAEDSKAMWEKTSQMLTLNKKLITKAESNYKPEIAIFFDDISPSYVGAVSPFGSLTGDFQQNITTKTIDRIGRIGAPVSLYLLSDLYKNTFDVSHIKMAILLNAYQVPNELRKKILVKLHGND